MLPIDLDLEKISKIFSIQLRELPFDEFIQKRGVKRR